MPIEVWECLRFAGVNPAVTVQDFLDNQMPIQNALTAVAERLWMLCEAPALPAWQAWMRVR